MLTRIVPLVARSVQAALTASLALAGKHRCFVAYWSHGNNFGDEYLSLALTRYLERTFPHVRVVHTALDLGSQAPGKGDTVIVAGGGLWGPSGTKELDSHLYSTWMRLKARLIVANLGIESFGGRSTAQLQALHAKAALFSVRDAQSLSFAEQALGKDAVLWGADTTYLSPMEILRQPVAHCIGVNLCGPEVENHFRDYSLTPIIEGLSALRALGHTLRAVAFSQGAAHADYPHCRRVDPDCPPSFSAEPYRQCVSFVGMRFHSVLLALQNRIPVVAINYSGKVRRLMQEYDLEDCCLEPDDPGLPRKLVALIQGMDKIQVSEKIRAGNARAEARLVPFTEELNRIMGKAGRQE